VPTDSTTIRRQLLSKLKSAERRFERAQEEWTRHQEHDQPAFERWQRAAVGALQQELMDAICSIPAPHNPPAPGRAKRKSTPWPEAPATSSRGWCSMSRPCPITCQDAVTVTFDTQKTRLNIV
jgi:hypothetical protein